MWKGSRRLQGNADVTLYYERDLLKRVSHHSLISVAIPSCPSWLRAFPSSSLSSLLLLPIIPLTYHTLSMIHRLFIKLHPVILSFFIRYVTGCSFTFSFSLLLQPVIPLTYHTLSMIHCFFIKLISVILSFIVRYLTGYSLTFPFSFTPSPFTKTYVPDYISLYPSPIYLHLPRGIAQLLLHYNFHMQRLSFVSVHY